jgi:hypothetical protein
LVSLIVLGTFWFLKKNTSVSESVSESNVYVALLNPKKEYVFNILKLYCDRVNEKGGRVNIKIIQPSNVSRKEEISSGCTLKLGEIANAISQRRVSEDSSASASSFSEISDELNRYPNNFAGIYLQIDPYDQQTLFALNTYFVQNQHKNISKFCLTFLEQPGIAHQNANNQRRKIAALLSAYAELIASEELDATKPGTCSKR